MSINTLPVDLELTDIELANINRFMVELANTEYTLNMVKSVEADAMAEIALLNSRLEFLHNKVASAAESIRGCSNFVGRCETNLHAAINNAFSRLGVSASLDDYTLKLDEEGNVTGLTKTLEDQKCQQ